MFLVCMHLINSSFTGSDFSSHVTLDILISFFNEILYLIKCINMTCQEFFLKYLHTETRENSRTQAQLR